MILDAFNLLSDAQTLTVSAFSDNVIDLGTSRNIGAGMPQAVQIAFPTELDSAGEAVTLRVLALLSSWSVAKAFTTDFATDNRLDVTAHGLAVGDRVLVRSTAEDLPAPLVSTTIYYVKTVPSANEITLAASKGGAEVALTDNGTGTHSILGGFNIVGDSTLIDEDDLEAQHGSGLFGGAASGVAFAVPLRALPIYQQGKRYVHLFYVVGVAAFTAGTVTASLAPGNIGGPAHYPSGFSVT